MRKVWIGFILIFLLIDSYGFCKDYLDLHQAISWAVRNNVSIKRIIEEKSSALEKKKANFRNLLPKLSFSYNYTRLKDSPFIKLDFGLYNKKIEIGERDQFSWDITVTQPIFTGFALITKERISSLNVVLKDLEFKKSVLDLIKMVKEAYLKVLLKRKFLKVAERKVKRLRFHLRDAREFYSQGLIPYNDLLKSEVALKQAEQNLVKAKSELRIAVYILNSLLERDLDEKVELKEPPLIVAKSINVNDLVRYALKHRPEIKFVKLLIKEANLSIRLAKSSFYPKIYLFGKYEQTGDNIFANENEYQSSHNAMVGINLKWTFFESGKRLSEIKSVVYQKLALQNRLKEVKKLVRLDVKKAYESFVVAKRNLETAKDALKQAKENYRITDLQYKQQLTTSTEVLDAQTFLTQAEVNYFKALYGLMIAKAYIDWSVGKIPKYLKDLGAVKDDFKE